MRLLLLLALVSAATSARWTVYPGSGYTEQDYAGTVKALSSRLSNLPNASLCLSHGMDGAEALLQREDIEKSCAHGVVLLAGAPSAESLAQLPQRLPVLVVQGTRDGVVRFSEFAVSRHRALAAGLSHARFVTVPGASHHSFTSAPKLSPLASEVDLTSSLGQDLTHGNISA